MTAIKNASNWTKNKAWQFFSAAITEKKDGVQAISLTRVLALICFVMLMWKWGGITGDVDPMVLETLIAAEIDVPMALKSASEVPDTLIYTFLGLLGGKTLESVMALWKGKKGA